MTSKREDWSIEIRDDNRDGVPEIVAKSEYVIRGRSGARHVDQALPPLRTALENLAGIPVALEDGHETTLLAIVSALRKAASEAIDMHEGSLPEDFSNMKPQCLAQKLREHRSGHRVIK